MHARRLKNRVFNDVSHVACNLSEHAAINAILSFTPRIIKSIQASLPKPTIRAAPILCDSYKPGLLDKLPIKLIEFEWS